MDRLAEHVKELFDFAPDGYLVTDSHGTIEEANRAIVALLRVDQRFLIGKPLIAFVTPEERPAFQALLARLQEGMETRGWEVHLQPRHSTFFPASLSVTVAPGGEGRRGSLYWLVRDVTRRKQAEEALRESEARFRSLCACSPVGIFITDSDGQTIYTNLSLQKMWGFTQEAGLGEDWVRFLHPEDREEVVAGWFTCAREGREFSRQYRIRTPQGGVRWIHARAYPMLSESGQLLGHAGTSEDITERRQAEELRTRLIEKVMAAHEEERHRIARELHDGIGQSLTGLLLGLQTLEAAPTLEAARVQAVDLRKIAAAAATDIRHLARGLRPRALDELGLAAALERYTAEYARIHSLKVDMYAPGSTADRLPTEVETALYRIIQEALTNTAKHARAQAVSIVIDRQPSFVQAIVEDDGHGFLSEAWLGRAVVDDHFGLAGMRERAALLNGSLTVESAPGSGTTVCVRIPLGEGNHGPHPGPDRR